MAVHTLWFGDWKAWDWDGFPILPFLFFTKSDVALREETQQGDAITRICRFSSTTGRVRDRLEARGLNLGYCEQLLSQMRALPHGLFEYGASVQIDRADLQWLQDTLRKVVGVIDGQTECGVRDVSFLRAVRDLEDEHDLDATLLKRMVFGEFFVQDQAGVVDEAVIFVVLRTLLDLVPGEASVVFEFVAPDRVACKSGWTVGGLYDQLAAMIVRRLEVYYRLFGSVLVDDPAVDLSLRKRIGALNEDRFLRCLLRPLMQKMGFEDVRIVEHHGGGEFGRDILPLRRITVLGTAEYYAIQAKATKIHGNSKRTGNVSEVISQACQALTVQFVDGFDNEKKSLDKFIIASNQGISADARQVIEDAMVRKRTLVFLGADEIVRLIKQYGLIEYMLFSELI